MTESTDASSFPPCRAKSTPAPALDAGASQLFCLPHAGAGASAYRDWPGLLAPEIDAVPVQFPGREGRHAEPAFESAAELVAEMTGPMTHRARPDYAMFGHSMGALISYELAHVLAALGRPPRHLFVSGLGAPHLTRVGPRLHDLPDAELIQVIGALEGTTPEVLAQPELMQFLLPLFRADLKVWETYGLHRQPLPVPITAMGGRNDPSVSVARLAAWEGLTSAAFDLEVFDGGHFYHRDAPDQIVGLIKQRLRESEPVTATRD